MTHIFMPPRTFALLPFAAGLAAALAVPAHAQAPSDASTIRLAVANRLGETVYCLTDGTPAKEGCKPKFAWRKQGVEIQLPVREDGTVLALRTERAKAVARN